MVSRRQARPFASFFTALLLLHSDLSCSAGTGAFAPGTGIEVRGTVRFVNVEGGCWDGAHMVLFVRLRTDLASVCMIGDIVDVELVESVHAP